MNQCSARKPGPLDGLTNMLIYEYNANITAFLCKLVECRLDQGSFSLCINHKEVLLGIWRICDVSNACKE